MHTYKGNLFCLKRIYNISNTKKIFAPLITYAMYVQFMAQVLNAICESSICEVLLSWVKSKTLQLIKCSLLNFEALRKMKRMCCQRSATKAAWLLKTSAHLWIYENLYFWTQPTSKEQKFDLLRNLLADFLQGLGLSWNCKVPVCCLLFYE